MRLTILSLPLLLVACEREPQTKAPPEPTTAPEQNDALAGTDTDVDTSPSSADTTDLGGITVAAPAGWTAQTPTSSMRRAQYVVEGDAGPAECVVFYFTGSGTIEANIDRWCGQFAQADGSDSRDHAEIDTIDVNGHEVTTFALSGRYIAETRPGSGQRVNNPNWAVRAAIVPSGDGAFYFKMTGPEQTVTDHAAAFDAMIESIS